MLLAFFGVVFVYTLALFFAGGPFFLRVPFVEGTSAAGGPGEGAAGNQRALVAQIYSRNCLFASEAEGATVPPPFL